MPLPGGAQPWPPQDWVPVQKVLDEWGAWYSGDPNRLAEVHSRLVFTPTPLGRFWSQEVREERRLMLHVPLAGDIASASADLLFSEAPRLVVPEAHAERASQAAKTTQEELLVLADKAGLQNRLLEAADQCAGVGGVYLRVVWDTQVADHPILAPMPGDAGIPEFRWGRLVAVTFWRVVYNDGTQVWRHLERHELVNGRGVILHGLYKGTHDNLGQKVSLDAHPATAGLEEVVPVPGGGLAVRYVPNMLPARRFRHVPLGMALGQADIAGAEGLLDALDEVYTSWVRDIRLAKARVLVPKEYLERGEDGRFRFDRDQEVFVPLEMDPTGQASGPITLTQFAIRTQEHEQAALHLIERIVDHAGYAPQTFGLRIEGRAESGTALRIRERKTFVTASRKQRYWQRPLEEILQVMLAAHREVFGATGVDPDLEVKVQFEDSIAPSTLELAQTAEVLARAKAASTETLVRLVHPDWSDEQVQKEVDRIAREQGLNLPSPMEVGLP